MNLNRKEIINKLNKINWINSELMSFEIKNEILTLRTYNEYVKLQCYFAHIKDAKDLICVVNPKVLLSILTKIKNDEVDISLIEDQLVLTSNQTTLNLNSINQDEFKTFDLKDADSFQSIPLSTKEYFDINKYVVPYCADLQQNVNAHLLNTNCIDLQTNENHNLYAYATDYKRIVSYELLTHCDVKMNLIIYAKCFNWITKVFSENEQLQTKLTQTNLLLINNQDYLEIGLMQLTFPNVKSVIDNKNINIVKVNVNELIDALERGLVITKSDSTLVVCDFNGLDMLLSFKNSEKGYVQEVIKIENIKGEMSTFCINIHYLLIALRNINTEFVLFSMEDNLSALYIYTQNNKKLLQAVLPTKNLWN